jgi:hypothetical protein
MRRLMAGRLRQIARDVVRAQAFGNHYRDRAVSERCKQLLAELRKNCPGLLPPDPLPPGGLGPTLPLDTRTARALYLAALRPEKGESVLWREGDNELLVEVSKVDIRFGDSIVMVSVPVRCDQVGRRVIHVPFALGSGKRQAGMVAATESRPRGPAEIVDLWGEALTALAWQALLRVAATLASESGRDLDGAGLIPIALAATEEGLQLRTMARHAFDRVAPTLAGQRRK